MALCSIEELSILLGVAVVTLRRWHAAGTLVPVPNPDWAKALTMSTEPFLTANSPRRGIGSLVHKRFSRNQGIDLDGVP